MENKLNGNLSLKSFLPYRLATLSNRISQGIACEYEEKFQLSIAEWRVMAVLGEEKDLSALEVGERTAMDKVAVSRAVSKLLDAGRLERKFAADDKRRSVLSLSAKGSKVYDQVVPLALSYEGNVLEKLSQSEKEQLDNLLTKLEAIQVGAE